MQRSTIFHQIDSIPKLVLYNVPFESHVMPEYDVYGPCYLQAAAVHTNVTADNLTGTMDASNARPKTISTRQT